MSDNVSPAVTNDVMVMLCTGFIARAKALGLKGKKRDDAALEYMCGAIRALDALGATEAVKSVGLQTYLLISPRGFSEVERIAREAGANV